jgi:signal transduction histidine kinase
MMNSELHLLIADDEPIIRRKVCLMLQGKFRIDQADTALSAREAAKKCYDAILLDIVFPDGNGIEICKEIKERDPHSTVLISSSMETVDAWNEAFAAGADGYLEKRELLSLDPRKISVMIENLVERNRLRRQAEELNQRQAELLSILSHDVRAPFHALLGTIELLRRTNEPSTTAAGIETLYQCAKDQLAFINSLLELLRLESGTAGLRAFPLDVNLPVNQCMQGLRILASAKEILLDTDLALDLPKVRGDIGRISQLVNNLVTNAIKFTPTGGMVKTITQAAIRDGVPGVEIRVEDTGVGIKSSERVRIFQRFHRGRAKGTDGERGAGLGLSICKEIMQLHGGALEVASGNPRGTIMIAWFPINGPTIDADLTGSVCRTEGSQASLMN